MEANIKVEGENPIDLLFSIETVMKKIRQGYEKGQVSNDTMSYRFEVD